MNWGWLALNAAYLVYAASGAFKDMLRLRITLLAATGLFVVYGLVADIWSVVWWNLPVALVHGWHVWKLLQERRGIDLDAEAEAIHTLLFPELDRPAFHRLWATSTERTIDDGSVLITKGEPVEELLLVLDGEVEIVPQPGVVLRLGRLRLVGEMSSVSANPASATVTTHGDVRVRAWDKERLATLSGNHPRIERAMLQAIGKELTRKLL